jgi:hypothetical protein
MVKPHDIYTLNFLPHYFYSVEFDIVSSHALGISVTTKGRLYLFVLLLF